MNINTHKIQNTLNGIKSYYYNNKSFYSSTSRSKYGKSLNGILYSMNLALEMQDYEYIENNFGIIDPDVDGGVDTSYTKKKLIFRNQKKKNFLI